MSLNWCDNFQEMVWWLPVMLVQGNQQLGILMGDQTIDCNSTKSSVSVQFLIYKAYIDFA